MRYRCPEHIAKLFDDPDTTADGRRQAFEWAQGLDLKFGDEVWLPEIGWTEMVGKPH